MVCTVLKKSEGHFLLQAYFTFIVHKLALLFQTKFYNITLEQASSTKTENSRNAFLDYSAFPGLTIYKTDI